MKKQLAFKLLRKSDREPVELIQELADYLGVDLQEHFNKSPVEHVHELDDSPDKAYLWSLDCTDQQLTEFTQKVQSAFVEKYNRDPQSLHFIRNDIDDVSELSPAEIRERVEPWLN